MKILTAIHNNCSKDIAKFYIGAILALIAAIFTFVQWILPLYWERQPNFKMSFLEQKSGNFIQAEPLVGEEDQCLVTGTVELKNDSKAPLFLKNTNIVFIPYKVHRCPLDQKKCVSSQNMPSQFSIGNGLLVDTAVSDLVSDYHHLSITPVTLEHDLFSGGTTLRPFSALIPTKQIFNERMIVLAEQEYGSKGCASLGQKNRWYESDCKTSRTLIHVSWPCLKPLKTDEMNKKPNKSSQKS